MPVDVDYKALSFYLQLINSLGVVFAFVYTWLSNRHKANASAIEKLDKSMHDDAQQIAARFARIETDIKHLPTHHDMGTIYERVNELSETISQQVGQLKQMNQTLLMINEHMLRNK